MHRPLPVVLISAFLVHLTSFYPILFQHKVTRFSRNPLPVLLEATVTSSGMGRDVHSLTLSFQHFLCQPWHCPPSKVPWRMVLERLLWHVTCLNHLNFLLLTVARRDFCGPTRQFIWSASGYLSCAPGRRCREVSSGTWSRKPGFFPQSQQGRSISSSRRGWSWWETCMTWTFSWWNRQQRGHRVPLC